MVSSFTYRFHLQISDSPANVGQTSTMCVILTSLRFNSLCQSTLFWNYTYSSIILYICNYNVHQITRCSRGKLVFHILELKYRISLWNYSHYFPLKRWGSLGVDSIENIISEIASNGYGVELWPIWSSWRWSSPSRLEMESKHENLLDEAYRERLKALLTGIPSSWHSGGVDTFEEHQRQIDSVSYLNSDVIVVHAEELHLDGVKPNFDFVNRVLNYAEEKNVTIAVENSSTGETEKDPKLWNISILKRAMDQLDDLKICLDTAHVYKHHHFSMKECVDTLKERLFHLHISDVFPLAFPPLMHSMPGTGIIPKNDWLYLVKVLEEIDFQGAAVLETQPLRPLQIAMETKEFFKSLSS